MCSIKFREVSFEFRVGAQGSSLEIEGSEFRDIGLEFRVGAQGSSLEV
jgi:hypothetical protein